MFLSLSVLTSIPFLFFLDLFQFTIHYVILCSFISNFLCNIFQYFSDFSFFIIHLVSQSCFYFNCYRKYGRLRHFTCVGDSDMSVLFGCETVVRCRLCCCCSVLTFIMCCSERPCDYTFSDCRSHLLCNQMLPPHHQNSLVNEITGGSTISEA